ncbi:MAG: CPBP family intramembrane glutamic endopeptidase [Propionicimonas sp.]
MTSSPLSSEAPGVPSRGFRSWLRRYPLTSFFGLALGFSWLVSLPYLLSVWGIGTNPVMGGFMLKQWIGPALAGLVMAGALGGRGGLRELRSKGRKWRIGWLWWVAVTVVPPLLILLGVFLVVGVPAVPPAIGPGTAVTYLVSFVLVFIAVGLPEEIGWRGFALPRLQARFGPLVGTLILGVLWAGWHLPFFLVPDHGGGPNADWIAVATNFALFTLMVVILSIPLSFVFNRTGGSVFATALLHAAIDTPQLVWLPLLMPVGSQNSTSGEWQLNLAVVMTFGVVAALIVVLTRGRLGWSPTGHPALPTVSTPSPTQTRPGLVTTASTPNTTSLPRRR